MSESAAETMRQIEAELLRDAEIHPIIALLDRLEVPLPTANYAPIKGAPKWVATRYDGCPNCMIRDNVPVVWAIWEETLVCAYQCNRCRHAWWTGWGVPFRDVDEEAAA
jgi:hypothetical protein